MYFINKEVIDMVNFYLLNRRIFTFFMIAFFANVCFCQNAYCHLDNEQIVISKIPEEMNKENICEKCSQNQKNDRLKKETPEEKTESDDNQFNENDKQIVISVKPIKDFIISVARKMTKRLTDGLLASAGVYAFCKCSPISNKTKLQIINPTDGVKQPEHEINNSNDESHANNISDNSPPPFSQ